MDSWHDEWQETGKEWKRDRDEASDGEGKFCSQLHIERHAYCSQTRLFFILV